MQTDRRFGHLLADSAGPSRTDYGGTFRAPGNASRRSYIRSIVRSIREHALEALSHHRTVRRIADRPGRPDRTAIIAQMEAEDQARRADEKFQEAVNDLESLDVLCLDPIQGQALVRFVLDEQLAWYIYDMHDAVPFRFWRFQFDPEDTRRPITPKQKGTETTRVV
jgi:hypothetical protein